MSLVFYGWEKPLGMAIGAGIDLPLPWSIDTRKSYDLLMQGYKDGLFSDADLDNAVKNVFFSLLCAEK